MTNEWDSPENITDDRQSEFDCGRIVARMPDLDECQPIQRPLSPAGTIFRHFVSDWILLSRFRKKDVHPENPANQNRAYSKKFYVFAPLILVGILCITVGGILLYKEHKKARKAERAAAQELQKQEDADKKAKEDADKKAKEDADKKAKEDADKKAKEDADKKAKEDADKKAKEIADKKAKEDADKKKAEEEKKKAEQETAAKPAPEKKPDEKKPEAVPPNSQSPWERTASEAYSPWGMATTRQMDTLRASSNAQLVQVQPPSVPLPAIPTAPGTIGQSPQGTGNFTPPYNTMVPPSTAVTAPYRPHAPPTNMPPQHAAMRHGQVPVYESQLTSQNVSGMTASGHYVPSAVHELSQWGNPRPQSTVPPSVPPQNAIRPLGPIPGQSAQMTGNMPRVATTAPQPG